MAGCDACACGDSVHGFSKVLKYLFMIVNVLFFILGIIVLAVVAYVQVAGTANKLDQYYTVQYPAGFIALGVIVAVFAFFGCCGAWKESKILLTIYAFVIGLLLVAEIAIVAYAASQGTKDTSYFSTAWNATTDSDKLVIQAEENCCGFNDINDRPANPCPPSANTGCRDAILNAYKTNAKVLYAGSALLALEIVGFALSLVVCCHIHRKPKMNENQPKIQ